MLGVDIEYWPEGYPQEDSKESFEVFLSTKNLVIIWGLRREVAESLVSAWENNGGSVDFELSSGDCRVRVDPEVAFINPTKEMVIMPGNGMTGYLDEEEGNKFILALKESLKENKGNRS